MIRVEKIAKPGGTFHVNIFSGDGDWLYDQPINPTTGRVIESEQEADEVAQRLIDAMNAPVPPTYQQLEQKVEQLENQLLLAEGVI